MNKFNDKKHFNNNFNKKNNETFNEVELVSIITPLYNSSKYIEETIKSVLAQTYKLFEWIIVDDNSNDNSVEIVKKYKDPRIHLLTLNKNYGVAYTRNRALDFAIGKYITFLDSDDLLDPNYLEEQVKFIKDNGPVITSGYRRMTPNSVTNFIPPKESNKKSIVRGNPLSCLSTMYIRSKYPNVRFPLGPSRHEDLVFWYELLKDGTIAKGNPKVLATYRILKGSRNNDKRKLVKPLINVYRKELKFNYIKSLYLVFRVAMYSKKKYKDVK